MAGKYDFYYLGNDEAYLKNLQVALKKFIAPDLQVKRFFETDEAKIQALFIKIYQQKPNCVFIDFSQCTLDYLHLARLISRTPMPSKIITVGLVDILSKREVILESMATGIDLTFVKNSEVSDVIFEVGKLLAPQEKREHSFAVAALKETWQAAVPCKVGYVHENGLHMETDFSLAPGSKIEFQHYWQNGRIVPSSETRVVAVSQENLYYHYPMSADLEFDYVDEIKNDIDLDPKTLEEKRNQRVEAIEESKFKMRKWIEANKEKSQEKKARVLIIDPDFMFYQNQKRTDKHPYTIRCIAEITSAQEQLKRIHPQVVAVAVKKENEAELPGFMAYLRKTYQDSLPYVVLFNVKENTKEFQTRFQYPNLMATQNEISVEVLVRMAEIFEKKMTESQIIKIHDPFRVFIKKTHPASMGEIMITIDVKKISETDLFFTTMQDLRPGANIHLKYPVDMFLNVQLEKADPKGNEYHGLIHSLGEGEKKELRRYVNSVFFRDHDAQLQAETEEFKKLNEQKLAEKTAAEAQELEKAELEKKDAS